MTAGLIFDYGGTLDTGGQHWGQVLWHAYERHHVPVTEAQFREAYVHAERTLGRNPIIRPDFTFRQTLEAKLRLQMDFLERNVECGMRNENTHTADPALQCNLIPHSTFHIPQIVDELYERTVEQTSKSRNVLQAMKGLGLPLVLVSNFYGNMPVVLREFGFDGFFLQVIESAVVGIRKPDPRIFLLGVEALGLKPEEVMVVGDSLDKDIIPAMEAGCQTVWLRGEGWNTRCDERTKRPVPVIDSLDELLKMIEKKYTT